jgi:hypothetical protein
MLLWHSLLQKYFPNMNFGRSKQGDPRKSLAFKICYKLVRESFTYLDEKDYNLYVRSQLEVLKHLSQQHNNISVDINCLVGNQAWKRWLLWKSRYDKKLKKPDQTRERTLIGEKKALAGIQSTYDFLNKNFGLSYLYEHLEVRKKDIIIWLNINKISPYYVVLSPFMKKLLSKDDLSAINFDSKFYEECITPAVKSLYEKLFKNEISTA